MQTRSDAKSRAEIDLGSVLKAYERWAPVYDGIFGVITRRGREATIDWVNAQPAARVLEAGVGTGISLPGYKRDHRITGFDISPDMLAKAHRRVAEQGLDHVEALYEMDAAELRFPDASFDIVVAMYVMTVVPDPDRVLAEFARVTRPGGRFIVVNHFHASRGPRALAERALAPLGPKLGWRPNFGVERLTGRGDLRLIEASTVPPFGLFSFLVFERI